MSVRVSAAPKQTVTVTYQLSCYKAINKSSVIKVSNGNYRTKPPNVRSLSLPLSGADECTVTVGAQLTKTEGKGRVKVAVLAGYGPRRMGDLDRALQTVVERCLAVQPGEDVLVVADPGPPSSARRSCEAARAAGGDAVLLILPPSPDRGTEPPPRWRPRSPRRRVHRARLPSLSHTKARKRASEAGARGATLPGVTEDLLARLMSADFDAMARAARRSPRCYRRRRGPHHLPARHRPAPRPDRPRRHPRRRRPHRARRVRQPALRRGLHRRRRAERARSRRSSLHRHLVATSPSR